MRHARLRCDLRAEGGEGATGAGEDLGHDEAAVGVDAVLVDEETLWERERSACAQPGERGGKGRT